MSNWLHSLSENNQSHPKKSNRLQLECLEDRFLLSGGIVVPLATATTINCVSDESTYGQKVTFTATVAAIAQAASTPAGTVIFEDGGKILGTESLHHGTCTFTTSILDAGAHDITAVFQANSKDQASTSTALDFSISPATLIVTAASKTKVYGGANPTLTASYSGFVNGDSVDSLGGRLTLTTDCTAASHVGAYSITPGGLSSDNYSIEFVSSTLTVTPAKLTITAVNKTKTYGAKLPALTVRYSGFVNGDTAASLSEKPTLSTIATVASHVGTYVIDVSGAVDPDYTIVYKTGKLRINPAKLTIHVNSETKEYGAELPALTVSYVGFVNGDTAASLEELPVVRTTATARSNVGSYSITASGAVDPDYKITYAHGTLRVTAAPLTIRVIDTTKVYGSALPELEVDYSGFVNGDTAASLKALPVLHTATTAGSQVGVYTVTASGAKDSNYTITYVRGTLTVTPASLTVIVSNSTRLAGMKNPVFTATIAGFVNGDTPAMLRGQLRFITLANPTSPDGEYEVTASGLTSRDYRISYREGTLTVASPPKANVPKPVVISTSVSGATIQSLDQVQEHGPKTSDFSSFAAAGDILNSLGIARGLGSSFGSTGQSFIPAGLAARAWFPAETSTSMPATTISGAVVVDDQTQSEARLPAAWTVLLEQKIGDAFVEIERVETDDQGHYAFTKVSPGDYRVRILPPAEISEGNTESARSLTVTRTGAVIERTTKLAPEARQQRSYLDESGDPPVSPSRRLSRMEAAEATLVAYASYDADPSSSNIGVASCELDTPVSPAAVAAFGKRDVGGKTPVSLSLAGTMVAGLDNLAADESEGALADEKELTSKPVSISLAGALVLGVFASEQFRKNSVDGDNDEDHDRRQQ
jgi:hypothetical protein